MRKWPYKLILLLSLVPGLARAETLFCFEQAADYYQVPVVLLRAIARHESDMKPDLTHRNKDGTLDIGLMQVNEWWLPKIKTLGIERQDLFDPCVNTYVGAWILAQNLRRTSDVWLAVGAYNAGWRPGKAREERRKRYADQIRKRVSLLQDEQWKKQGADS